MYIKIIMNIFVIVGHLNKINVDNHMTL